MKSRVFEIDFEFTVHLENFELSLGPLRWLERFALVKAVSSGTYSDIISKRWGVRRASIMAVESDKSLFARSAIE